MALQDRLDKIKGQPAPFVDVPVYLGVDVDEQLEEISGDLERVQAQIAAAVKKAAERQGRKANTAALEARAAELGAKLDAVEEQNAGALITLRITRMPAEAYAELTGRFAARLDNAADLDAHYNIDKVARAAATVCLSEVDGETVTQITPEQAAEMLPEITGGEWTRIRDAILTLNDYGARYRIVAAKKAHPTSQPS